MPRNDRRAAADAGKFNIAKIPRSRFVHRTAVLDPCQHPNRRTVTIHPLSTRSKAAWLTFLRMHLIQMAVIGTTLAPTLAAAQQVDPGIEAAAELARVAMQCAMLAAEAGDGAAPRQDLDRLVAVAMPNLIKMSEAGLAAMQADEAQKSLGPFAPTIRTYFTSDFVAGLTFAGWSAAVTAVLDEKAGKWDATTMSFDDWWKYRQWQAEVEFGSRNCRLIGR